jgi:thiamine biosynthesis lipoprotein
MGTSAAMKTMERARQIDALGGVVDLRASGADCEMGLDQAELSIRDLQARLTRFESDSELSRLNEDPRAAVPASPVMLRFADLVGYAGRLSGGLVDATCLDAVELAGYTESFDPGGRPVTGAKAGLPADPTRPGGGDPAARWRFVSTDRKAGEVQRPPEVRLDSGGIGKGLAADIGAEALSHCESFAVSCVGDIRFGGTAGIEREILVSAPEGDGSIATIRLASGAVATSGTTRRTWTDEHGRKAHHLINPLTGRPAHTGITQVTAIAPTGVEAEVRAKSALLAGPGEALAWLIHGGVVVLEDGRVLFTGENVESGEALR